MPTIAAQAIREYLIENNLTHFSIFNVDINLYGDCLSILRASGRERQNGPDYVVINYADPELFVLLDKYIDGMPIKVWGGEPLIKPFVEPQAVE